MSNGEALVAPRAPLVRRAFTEDGGDEPEIAGIDVIGPDGEPCRIGFALANEFCDQILEKRDYLYLAHSKLRHASVGPEILVGTLAYNVEGTSRIRCGDAIGFEKPFRSGEADLSHSIANPEHHHFEDGMVRRPGDVHVRLFATATRFYAAALGNEDGNVFEIKAAPFGLPLVNPLVSSPSTTEVQTVRVLCGASMPGAIGAKRE